MVNENKVVIIVKYIVVLSTLILSDWDWQSY
jgi:hypothetical protein